MASQKIKFTNRAGYALSAILDSPSISGVKAYAIFAHCFTCSKDIQAVRTISRSLGAKGIAVLRFDFTGLGRSEGEFADTNFSSNLGDLESAADSYNFQVDGIASLESDGRIVSSTLIRRALSSGNLGRAAELLGQNYRMSGEVIHGNHLGRRLGFPTAIR